MPVQAAENMKKLLVVCGPTSTGKTSLALKIAKKFNGEIVSADSRQVYKGMDIGTGKDIPKNSKLKYQNPKIGGFYEVDGVGVWGYDLIGPKKEFSVAQYLKAAHRIIDNISGREKLPILVGGTGLYIKAVTEGIQTADIPKNIKLRENLEEKTAEELYESLSQLDSLKSASLNASDRKNPRRLIRAIEVAQYQLTRKAASTAHHAIGNKFDMLFIGLTAPQVFLEARIEKRVEDRLKRGVKKEVEKLLRSGVKWEDQAMASIGYGLWRDYFEGGVSENEVVLEWIRDERRYAKRQMVWFKKDERIVWFDITAKTYSKSVENLIKKWYYRENVS